MSKGLEAIQEYKRVTCSNCQYKDKENCDVLCFSNIIEKELKDYYSLKKECEEAKWYQEHKVLEIINKKNIDVALLKLSENVERYNEQIKLTHLTIPYYELTKEEYDLLKEELL